MSTNVEQFFADLDGGVFEEKLSHMLSQVAGAVVDHSRKGSITITLDVRQIGNGCQVQVDHKLKYNKPTSRGSVVEDEHTSTPMHVGSGGALSFFPENQGQIFGKKGEPARTPYPADER